MRIFSLVNDSYEVPSFDDGEMVFAAVKKPTALEDVSQACLVVKRCQCVRWVDGT